MDYKELLQQIKDFLSACEHMRYGDYVGVPWPYNHDGPMVYTEPDAVLLDLAATAITDLLACAEAAEARAKKAERERDAAIERLREDHWCDDCKHSPVSQACRNDGECSVCESKCYCGGCENGSLWEWNGKEE